jgi:predicted nucleotidyltransferase
MTGNDALLKLLVVLNQLSIPYMLVGSYSSNIYGIPRMTKDADLVLQLDGSALSSLNKNLPEGLSLEEQSFFETVTATRKELLHIDGTNFQIELFHLSSDPFDQSRFKRRVKSEIIDGLEVSFPTAEDVIIQKLRWARNKDFDDVVAILRVQTNLDFDQINHWCGIHETLSLLEKARAEADGR